VSEQRKLRNYLGQLSETRGIMDAMKNLAVVELHKLDRHLENQHQMILDLERTVCDFLNFYPYTFSEEIDQPDILIVFGSERGFCGDFNESLINNLDIQISTLKGVKQILITVGTRLLRRLGKDTRVERSIEGADVVEEVPRVLNNLLIHLGELQSRYGSCNVYTFYHHLETGQLTVSQLLPPFKQLGGVRSNYTTSPVLNLSPEDMFAALVDLYLFTSLHETAYMSLMAENYSRILHMTAALQKLDEQANETTRRYHIYRQEEITEEIEVILLNAAELT